MKIEKLEHNYHIVKDDGSSVILTCIEANILMTFMRKDNLRYLIDDQVDAAEADYLDLTKYEGTREEFIEEIFSEFEDEIDYGNNVDVDDIDDKISDLCTFYDLEKEE